jgi:hypothetical protein
MNLELIKPNKLSDISQFAHRIFKILTNGKTQTSSYIFNDAENRWEYFSRRGNKWKTDKNQSKFTAFIVKGVLPYLKKLKGEILDKLPFIKEIIAMLVDVSTRIYFIEKVLATLLPLLCTSGNTFTVTL